MNSFATTVHTSREASGPRFAFPACPRQRSLFHRMSSDRSHKSLRLTDEIKDRHPHLRQNSSSAFFRPRISLVIAARLELERIHKKCFTADLPIAAGMLRAPRGSTLAVRSLCSAPIVGTSTRRFRTRLRLRVGDGGHNFHTASKLLPTRLWNSLQSTAAARVERSETSLIYFCFVSGSKLI